MTDPNQASRDQHTKAVNDVIAQIIRWKRESAVPAHNGGRNGKVAGAELAMTAKMVQVGEPAPDNGVVASSVKATVFQRSDELCGRCDAAT